MEEREFQVNKGKNKFIISLVIVKVTNKTFTQTLDVKIKQMLILKNLKTRQDRG